MPLTLLLRCRDLEETRRFYQSALGFNARDTANRLLKNLDARPTIAISSGAGDGDARQ